MEIYKPQLIGNQHIFEPGIYDIENDIYHASAGISRSGISELKKSPLNYYKAYLSPNRLKKEETKQMLLGEAVHTMILEPNCFDERFAVSEKFDGRTSAGKTAKQHFQMINQDKKILDADQYLILHEIKKVTESNRLLNKLLENAKIEKSLFWIDSETELLCKARPDAWTPRFLIDIKTTSDSTFDEFGYSVRKYNYHIQAAMIIDAIKELTGVIMHDFIFVVIQTSPPYEPFFYNLGDYYIEWGRREYKQLLKVLRGCFDSGNWHRDRQRVIELDVIRAYESKYIEALLDCYQVNI